MGAAQPKQVHLDDLMCVHPHAAGLDIGGEEIIAAGPADCDPRPVRAFRTFTPDLEALVSWLRACGIDTVAMESTGVFWIPIYELLEQHGITPYLVNAHHVKTVPGRKSDWNDAQWHGRKQRMVRRWERWRERTASPDVLLYYRTCVLMLRAQHLTPRPSRG